MALATIRFGLLGPLEVRCGGVPVQVPAARHRALLGALLCMSNTVVPVDELAAAVWDQRPPPAALTTVRSYVMRLRQSLGEDIGSRIHTVSPGYLIEVGPAELDSDEFADLCAEARDAARGEKWTYAYKAWTEALGLWRGSALSDVATGPDAFARLRWLDRTRLLAMEGRAASGLRLGRHQELVPELTALAEAHPLHESFSSQLMLALYRSGRQAEALTVYRSLQHGLREELGVDPSTEPRQLHQRILVADPALSESVPVEDGPVPAETRPGNPDPGAANTPVRQLPPDTSAFTGRAVELGQLADAAHQAGSGSQAGLVVVSAIDGMGGVGKSALAIRAAHQARDRFPDGQLFIDLHGHTPGRTRLSPEDALGWFLRSLGIPPQLVPPGLHERAALYRDRLAGRRMLILLDNAISASQIRPLLPAAPGCLVIVTSRLRLTGLDDAHIVTLDTLPYDEATALLHRVAGPGRIPPDSAAAEEVAALCGYIPLAIRIAGARLRHRRALGIGDIAAELRDAHGRLDRLQDHERRLTAVFDSSYNALPPSERTLFGRLGRAPGTSFDDRAAATLLDCDLLTAERLLESLLDHNMLVQHTAGRYQFHDLMRLYAQSVPLPAPDGETDRQSAAERLLDYYEHTARLADRHLARRTRPGPAPVAPHIPRMPDLPTRTRALNWLNNERENLIAASCLPGNPPRRVIGFAAALGAYLDQEGPWLHALALHQAAVAAARGLDDPLAEAGALLDLARVSLLSGQTPQATDLIGRALFRYREIGDLLGEANAVLENGRFELWVGSLTTAADLLSRALDLYQELDDRRGQASATFELGRVRRATAQYPEAAELLSRSLALCREEGQAVGEANALCELGRTRQAAGAGLQAVAEMYTQALTLYQDLGSTLGEANALWDLGRLRFAVGDLLAADEMLGQALSKFQGLVQNLGVANALTDLGRVRTAQGDMGAAKELLEQALTVFREEGQRVGEANALTELGRVHLARGDLALSASSLQDALKLFEDIGDRHGEVEVLRALGALAEAGHPTQAGGNSLEEAAAHYQRALRLAREIQSPMQVADALRARGELAAARGDTESAHGDLREAVAIYQSLGAHSAATAVARHLPA